MSLAGDKTGKNKRMRGSKKPKKKTNSDTLPSTNDVDDEYQVQEEEQVEEASPPSNVASVQQGEEEEEEEEEEGREVNTSRAAKKRKLLIINRGILACGQANDLQTAFAEFDKLKRLNIEPSVHTYTNLINTCIRCGDLVKARELFRELSSGNSKLKPNAVTCTTYLKGLVNCGWMDSAQEVYSSLLSTFKQQPETQKKQKARTGQAQPGAQELTTRTFDTYLRGCLRWGEVDRAKRCFIDMNKCGLAPTASSYECVVKVLCQALLLDQAWKIAGDMEKQNLVWHSPVFLYIARTAALRGDFKQATKALDISKVVMKHTAANTTSSTTSSTSFGGANTTTVGGENKRKKAEELKKRKQAKSAAMYQHVRDNEVEQSTSELEAFLLSCARSVIPDSSSSSSLSSSKGGGYHSHNSQKNINNSHRPPFIGYDQFGWQHDVPGVRFLAPPSLLESTQQQQPQGAEGEGGGENEGDEGDNEKPQTNKANNVASVESPVSSNSTKTELDFSTEFQRLRNRLANRPLSYVPPNSDGESKKKPVPGKKGNVEARPGARPGPGNRGRGVSMELCSGSGEWIVSRAKESATYMDWVAVELRFERVFTIWSRTVFHRLDNLLVLQADATTVLDHTPAGSLYQLFINFPEPTSFPSILTARFLRRAREVLKEQGNFILLTDSEAVSTHTTSEFAQLPELFENVFETPFLRSAPSDYGSSFFDQLWKHGGRKKRYYINYRRL